MLSQHAGQAELLFGCSAVEFISRLVQVVKRISFLQLTVFFLTERCSHSLTFDFLLFKASTGRLRVPTLPNLIALSNAKIPLLAGVLMSSDWVHMHNASVPLPGLWSVTGSLRSSLCSTVGIHRSGEEEVELFGSQYSVSHA